MCFQGNCKHGVYFILCTAEKPSWVSHFLHYALFSCDRDDRDDRAMASIYFKIMGGERKRALWHLMCRVIDL